MTDGVTRRWVAKDDSARSAAAALCRYGFSRRAFWTLFAALWGFLTVLLALTFDREYATFSRWLTGGLYAALGTTISLFLTMGLVTLINWRYARQRLRPGTIWQLTATADSLTMSGPLTVHLSIPYQALGMVRVVGEWVLMQQRGVPMVTAWPRELFSNDALARMTSAAG